MTLADERLVLRYEVEDGDTPTTVELPFAVGVMANLSGQPRAPLPPIEDRAFELVTRATIEDLMGTLQPRVVVVLPSPGRPPSVLDDLEVTFSRLEDFDENSVRARIADLGAFEEPSKVSEACALVLQQPAFQELRAAWAGLAHLCERAAPFADVQIRAIDLSKKDLAKTLRKYGSTHWDLSPIFKKLFDERLAAHGGTPLGCLIGDFDFDQSAGDVATVESVIRIAEVSHCPFLTGASPRLVHRHRWKDLDANRGIDRLFSLPEYAGWEKWRVQPGARYLTLRSGTVDVELPGTGRTPVRAAFGLAAAAIEAFGREGSWRRLGSIAAGPRSWMDDGETASAGREGLAELLLGSRFQHYVRAIVRDFSGQDADGAHVRRRLVDFLMQYVDGSPDHSSDATKRLKPLAAVDVSVATDELRTRADVRLQFGGDGNGLAPVSDLNLRWRERTHISYFVELYGAERRIESPFVLGVIADFSGAKTDRPAADERRFRSVDLDNLDGRMREIGPTVAFQIQHGPDHPMAVALTFASLRDMSPRGIAERLPETAALLETRDLLSALITYCEWCDGAAEIVSQYLRDSLILPPGEPDASPADPAWVAAQACGVLTDDARSTIAAALRRLADLVRSGDITRPEPLAPALTAAIELHDSRISRLVNAVMHHPDFQQVERAWLGLQRLLADADVGADWVRMLDVSEREFREDLIENRQKSPTEGWLCRLLEAERHLPGGEPVGCFIAGYAFDHADVEILTDLGRIGEASSCPFVVGAKPSVYGMGSWQELGDPRDLSKIFSTPDYAPWRAFRDDAASRFVVLAMPRFLGRAPAEAADTSEGFRFVETCDRHEDFVWINAAFAVGRVVRRAFGQFGWPGQIAGVQTGGTVADLVPGLQPSRVARLRSRVPTEVAIGDRRMHELTGLGFAPLVGRHDSNRATFFHLPSLRAVSRDPGEAVNDASLRRDHLQYVLAECLFAQRISTLIRDTAVGAFRSADDLCRFVEDWIQGYVNESFEYASSTAQIDKPLASAAVSVVRRELDRVATHLSVEVRPGRQLIVLPIGTPLLVDLPQRLRRPPTEADDL